MNPRPKDRCREDQSLSKNKNSWILILHPDQGIRDPLAEAIRGWEYNVSAFDNSLAILAWLGANQKPALVFAPPNEYLFAALLKAGVDVVAISDDQIATEAFRAEMTKKYKRNVFTIGIPKIQSHFDQCVDFLDKHLHPSRA